MLLMPNTSGSSTRGGPAARPYGSMAALDAHLFPPAAAMLAGLQPPLRPPVNWASVASWFFRPECSNLLTTMAGADPNFVTASARPTTTSAPMSTPSIAPPTTTSPSSNTTTTSPSTSSTSMGKSSLHYRDPPTRERVFQAPTICTAIRCTVPSCSCECFIPGKRHLRYCETCKHGWVPHALDKLGTRHLFTNSAPEPVQPNAAFDIASLVLYGCQALPIRLKILLDRLFSVLQKEQVLQVLHGFGWTPEDYARGYILQDSHAVSSLDRWSICSPEEEPLVLQQFLRFGETRAITQQLLLAQQVLQQEPTLERLDRLVAPHSRSRAMSPSRRPNSPPPVPSAFHPSRLPTTMSPHQKHPLSFLKLPMSNGPTSSATTTSPSPRNVTSSPLNTSPLNRLQNMQPFDFRKFGAGLGAAFPTNRLSPEMTSRRRTSESDTQVGLNLSMSTSLSCLPPPPPIPTSLSHSAAMAAAAASVNSLAAAGLVSSFPGLISTRMSTGSKSPSTSDLMGNHFDGQSDDDDMDENSHSALNLSRDNKDAHKSRQARSVPGRKPGTPTKRHWGSPGLPLNLGTQFINPATGKKRVQCNVCLKTFCDKGALKIHFSAVHLREMHKCTVEGCNMMFSSRRSRNRHSANPNPKLHSPHLRRKISPHDGRSSQAHPIMIPPQAGLLPQAAGLNHLNPFNPFPLLTPPPDLRHPAGLGLDFKHSLDLSMHKLDDKMTLSDYSSMQLSTSNHEDDDDDDDDDGIVVVGGDEDDESSERIDSTNGVSDQPEDFSMPTKRQKMSVSDFDEDVTSNIDSNEDSLSVVDTHSLKDTNEECVLPTNKRKRKNQNPTRCAVAARVVDPPSDGDSSNDVFIERISIKRECDLKDIKPKIEEVDEKEPDDPDEDEREVDSNDDKITNSKNDDAPPSPIMNTPLDLGKRSPDVNANEPEPASISIAPLFSLETIKRETTQDNEPENEERERPASSVESNKSDEYFDCTNALRQLESLSHGNFGELVSRGLHLGLGGGHQASQFPPLGFMIGGGPPSPARSQTSSAGSSNGGESPDENSQNHVYGHFDNGQFISTMDVPIDKDNPRRCTACGKIFQNHFGVKTHYQNVHLKLMHKCNVDGCNAAFPSKRSRDRHSANLNLHRKLLSTSSDKSTASLFMDKSPFASLANSALHSDILARLYSEDAFKGHHLPHPAALEQMLLNGDRLPPPPLLLPPLGGLPFPLGGFNHFPQLNGSSIASRKDRSSGSNSPLSASPPPPLNSSPGLTASTTNTSNLVHCVEEDMPAVDKDGNLPCRLCRMTFTGAQQLKDHCEKHHLYEMHRCTVKGCDKVFLSKTKRNLHAENDSLHHNRIRKGFDASVS
ncbi:zinc finger protein basonuclin-2-like isoform X2 [Atheta coriaria]|uniref:zinc finger protein basonuclin-2-like isoform X2 n=1 Tax=Dalotia coriaria TaxID=877792 RepID=UPI0031F44298